MVGVRSRLVVIAGGGRVVIAGVGRVVITFLNDGSTAF